MKVTDNLNLNLPDFSNNANIEDLNKNSIIIDNEVNKLKVKLSNLEITGATKEEIEKLKKSISDLENAQLTINNKINNLSNNKVDKISGKGLSTNDFTNAHKRKVDVELPDAISKAGKVDMVNNIKPDENKNVNITGSDIPYKSDSDETILNKIDILNKTVEEMSAVEVKNASPTTSDKDYDVGQLWYNKNTGDLFIFKGVNTDGFAEWSTYQQGEMITDRKQYVFGVEVDETNLNPETAVTYIGDAVGMIPAKNGDYGSWEKWLKEISYRVVVKGGLENYKLNYDNPNKKLDGGSAVLTGEDGDVFTKFKHLYRKFEKTTKGYKLYISDEPFDGAVSYTTMLEDGYNQLTNASMVMLQDLYLITHKNRDSQTALGRGYVDVTSDDPFANTGGTNGKGYIYGEATGKQQMCFLGIEDMWGNKYQWVDGLVSDSSYNLLIGYKNFNDSGSNYKKTTTNTSSSLSGYAKTVQGGEAGYFLADKDASSSTGYCDTGYLGSGAVARFGGDRSDGSDAGACYVRLSNSASDSVAGIGSRLCFKNENGVYIGNYLGYEQSGKLRSIAGKEPTGSKTIGAFRTLAQANN